MFIGEDVMLTGALAELMFFGAMALIGAVWCWRLQDDRR